MFQVQKPSENTYWVGNPAFKTPTRPLNCWFSNCAIRLVRLSTLEIKNNTWVHCTVLYNWQKSAINILFVTWNNQTENLVFPNFVHVQQLKKKQSSLLQIFFSFGPMQSLFLFHLVKLRKIRGKKWGNPNLWFGRLMSRTR